MNSRLPVGTTARPFALLSALGALSLTILGTSGDARAQVVGNTTRPLPNVLLLVDSSGSMERMPDSSLPSDNRPIVPAPVPPPPPNACSPGVETTPNRWGMLIQALTGNLQPFFSCDAIPRTGASFKNEFKIGPTAPANQPYDADYFLPYHRPLTGNGSGNACAFAPYVLPGAAMSQGRGPGGLGTNTAPYDDASSFPPDAFKAFREGYLRAQYAANSALVPAAVAGTGNECSFEQANDGQLDSTKDYLRFGLMTFDNDPRAAIGVATPPLPNGGAVLSSNPFAGQWTYVKSATNPDPLGSGWPLGCAVTTGPTTEFDVGARHWAAPPWEGRMVRFPPPDGTLYDIARTNEEIQKVLIGTRPYGATPIDGMMEDARDYLWHNDYGPNGAQAGYRDDYVQTGGCRKQYIVLLTDGAPNLDLRPACEPGVAPGSKCPYPQKAWEVAKRMSDAALPKNLQVTTYVIGFSVNGAGSTSFPNDGFPSSVPADQNCKKFFSDVTAGGTNLTAMHTLCSTAAAPPKGSTADACCQLSEIAYYGTADNLTPPFFAESQADLALSFGRVLGGISKEATTRTLPGYSPAVSVSGTGVSADFVASFIPNSQKVWSGEIDRTRSICSGPTSVVQAQNVLAGDSFAYNTAAQAAAGNRMFVSVLATAGSAVAPFSGTSIDSAATIRPWISGAGDGVPSTGGTQVTGKNMFLATSSPGLGAWGAAMEIDTNTCKRSRDINGIKIPGLSAADCTQVIWGFAAATSTSLSFGGYPKFNVRCSAFTAGNAAKGVCSASGQGCTVGSTPCEAISGGKLGEVCVPECSALGAIYRSSPTLVGPPNELLRDDAYRALSEARKQRRPAMFVSSTDGVLHAYKALSTSAFPTFDNIPGEHELWAFIPPAVLPKLASNYPSGQQILLDGTPAVKDIVWDRPPPPATPLFHTTLVSGMGAGGGGYYGLAVTDVDCQGNSVAGLAAAPSGCLPSRITSVADLAQAGAVATQGPQFLWQVTDVEANAPSDTAKALRTARDGKNYVALFGKESGNPAIATLVLDPGDGGGTRQIGVAILPGGIDGPPVKDASCPRAIDGGALTAFPAGANDASDPAFPRRTSVRRWAAGACNSAPVPGRNVTVVRADTGEILRVFGRVGQDIPSRLSSRVVPTAFDSPIIGTPAIFPSGVGVATQKIFVGDADGTMWRLDVSNPDPANWSGALFQDLVSSALPGGPGAAQSQPIQIPPVLTQDPFGGVVLSASTGDQENLVASATERNYIWSIQEARAISAATAGRATTRWYQSLGAAERVTGPMTVFDRTLYFATYRPVVPNAAACTNGGSARLWGMDYFNPTTLSGPGTGGVPRWCPIGRVDAVSGACLDPLIPSEDPALIPAYSDLVGAIIPGVTIRASQSCATYSGPATDPLINTMSGTTFSLFFGATSARTGGTAGAPPQAARPTNPLVRPLPRTAANIDSWALVVD